MAGMRQRARQSSKVVETEMTDTDGEGGRAQGKTQNEAAGTDSIVTEAIQEYRLRWAAAREQSLYSTNETKRTTALGTAGRKLAQEDDLQSCQQAQKSRPKKGHEH